MSFDKSLLRPCPVLRPSQEEFDTPLAYISRPEIKDLGSQYGIVKIVPPDGWTPPFSISPNFSFHTRIQKLSDLGVTNRSRKFFVDNLNRFLRMQNLRLKVQQWFHLGQEKIYYYDLYLAVLRLYPNSAMLDSISTSELHKLNLQFGVAPDSRSLVQVYDQIIRPYANFLTSKGSSYDFPESDSEDDEERCLVCRKGHSPSQMLLCDNCNNPYHLKCLPEPLEEIPEGSWYCDRCLVGNGAYGFEEDREVKYTIWDFIASCKEFDKEFLESYLDGSLPMTIDKLEEIFWQLVESEDSELKVRYGADIHNQAPGEISGFPTSDFPKSVFDPSADTEKYIEHPWNLTQLPFAKGSLLNHLQGSFSGMTVPWIYVGSLLSTFCWHVEDHFTLSANYCHFGNIKKWYGIPSSHADNFELIMKSMAPDLFQRQPDLLHQLVTLISPSKLAARGVPVFYADQGPNEFVVTFPRVYHAGFNSGFNFNEAVNFTVDSWLKFGEQSVRQYREIKKENVFDHFKLTESVLRLFLGGKAESKELIGECIRSFERFYDRQFRLSRDMDPERLVKKILRRLGRPRLLRQSENSVRSEDLEDGADAEEDNLCDVCRTYVSYQYCVIDNHLHRFGRWYTGRPKRKETAITVNNLITPQSTPQTQYTAKLEDPRAVEVAASSSAEKLASYNTQSDEFAELVTEAKRKAAEEDLSQLKRRKYSKRTIVKSSLPEVSPVDESIMSQMKKVQYSTLLLQLNKLDSVKLCLECTATMCGERGEKAPRGSHLVVETDFSVMEDLLNAAKRKYMEIA